MVKCTTLIHNAPLLSTKGHLGAIKFPQENDVFLQKATGGRRQGETATGRRGDKWTRWDASRMCDGGEETRSEDVQRSDDLQRDPAGQLPEPVVGPAASQPSNFSGAPAPALPRPVAPSPFRPVDCVKTRFSLRKTLSTSVGPTSFAG